MLRTTHWSAAMIFLACAALAGCGGGGDSSATSSTSSASGTVTGKSGTGTTTTPGHSTGSTTASGYTISGVVSGISAASVALSGTAATSAVTDSSGDFSFAALSAGGYTVTPSLAGYVFTPVSLAAPVSSTSVTGLIFAGAANTAITYNISGTVTGSIAGGVVITLNGSNVGSTVTDLSGNYAFSGLVSGTYTVAAALAGYTFTTPLIISVNNADSAQNNFASVSAAGGNLTFAAVATLPAAKIGTPYSSTVVQAVSGGTAPYVYESGSLSAGSPPLGMIVNPSGNLTGTPSVAGLYNFTVCATDAAGETSACQPTSITVAAAGSGQPVPSVSLTANPSTIRVGGHSVLTWSSQNATSCTAGGGWSGVQAVSGTFTVAPTSSTSFAITCSGANGSANASALITVQSSSGGDAPTVTLTATNPTVAAGGTSTLEWSSTNATACAASGGWSGSPSTTGALTETPSATTTYNLTCTGAGGSASASTTITVQGGGKSGAPTVNLNANPSSITTGGSSTLSWTTANATSCTASGGWNGAQAVSGSQSVSPTATTTYTLICKGAGGSTQASTTVSVSSSGGGGGGGGTSWVYYNGTFDWPGDYSFVAVPNYSDTSGNPLSGAHDIKITLTGAYGGWLPYAQNWDFNSAGYTKLTFALKPTVANQRWNVYFVKVGDIPVGIYLNVLNYGPAPVVGQWNTYTVPLSDLGVLGTSIYKFCIQDQTGLSNNSWYVDNVGFVP